MTEENQKHHWLKFLAIAVMTFIIAFLAFYVVMELMVNRITDPMYNAKRIEKMVINQQRDIKRFEDRIMADPFEPKIRPMIVNLAKENNEYKIIVDLTPLDGDETLVNINVNDDILTVTGELDKKSYGREKIISFAQSYQIDEEVDTEKINKERKGNKYIITIPFKD